MTPNPTPPDLEPEFIDEFEAFDLDDFETPFAQGGELDN